MREIYKTMGAVMLRSAADVAESEEQQALQQAAEDVLPSQSEALSESDMLRTKIDKDLGQNRLPRMVDLWGRSIQPGTLPASGDQLNIDQALAICSRFRSRLQENPSAGSAKACYIRHVLYALGRGRASDLQRDLISTLSMYASRRSSALGRVVDFVNNSIEDFPRLRTTLTGLLRDQRSLIRSVGASSLAGEVGNKRLFAVGYSEAIVELIRNATSNGAKIDLLCWNWSLTGSVHSCEEAYSRALGKIDNVNIGGISMTGGDERIFQKFPPDLAFIATEAISVGQDGELTAVCHDFSSEIADALRSESVNAKIVFVSSLAKLVSSSDERGMNLISNDCRLHATSAHEVDLIVTEVGVKSAREFTAEPLVQELSRIDDPELFFTALIVRDPKKKKEYLGQKIHQQSLESPAVSKSKQLAAEPSATEKKELLDLMNPRDGVPEHFFQGRQDFYKRLRLNREWVRANEGKYFAGVGDDEFIVEPTVWEALRAARDKWHVQAPYVAQIEIDEDLAP